MRPLITKPQNVKYKILTYPEADTKLQADLKGDIASESIGIGDFHAVALEFSLPSGSYATIALREITRFQIVSVETEILNMRLSVKSADGKIEVFNGVQNWSFSALHRHVAERFNLKRYGFILFDFLRCIYFSDFALFFGSHQLPTDDTKLSESDMEFVSGDRLRLVINEKGLFPTDYASGSSCPEISAGTGSNNSNSAVKSETVFEIVLHEMKQKGFEVGFIFTIKLISLVLTYILF
ncbi:unnamed protein product [Onchocerca flexuosa]|uniref:Ubiquitin-like domain-containing protein n=1 Tax=Onchocerca flexuosa TaxID=387005 RepID=A0A183HBK6_9BILA|nr:unnamed protein product [Onchocerca flexuosa]